MCARKIILDSDDEDDEVIEAMAYTKEVSIIQAGDATSSLSSNNLDERNPFVKFTTVADASATGLPSPKELRRSKTTFEEPIAADISKSPSVSRIKRNKTTIGEHAATSQKVKKLYGTKTTLDDLRLREGRRNELWEQAVDSDCAPSDARKLKRKQQQPETETKSFAELLSAMTPSQDSLVVGGTTDNDRNFLESALKSHEDEADEAVLEKPERGEMCTMREIDIGHDNTNVVTQQVVSDQPSVLPIASSETLLGTYIPQDPPVSNALGQAIAVSITRRDEPISQSPIIAPSISQLSNHADQPPPKPSRKRTQSIVSSQADELASEDIIGHPKEQYKPRPSRSRRQNDHVDELVKGIDYSKTVESVVRSARKGKIGKSKAKRRQTTGCLLGSTKDWDEDEDAEKKDTEVQIRGKDDIVPMSQRRSKTAATETIKPKEALSFIPECDDKDEINSMNKDIATVPKPSPPENLAESDEDDITKPTRRRKQETTRPLETQTLPDTAESDEDNLQADEPVRRRGRRNSTTTTQPENPTRLLEDPENTNEDDDFHPLEDLAEPPTSDPKPKKRRGRPKKQDAEPLPEPTTTSTQPAANPPLQPPSKRRKTREIPLTPIDETHTTPLPPAQPLAESPVKANATVPSTIADSHVQDEVTEKFTTQLVTPQKGKGAAAERAADGKEAPSPSRKHHSPLSSSKVPLRVGLSRRQRIEPLLRVRR